MEHFTCGIDVPSGPGATAPTVGDLAGHFDRRAGQAGFERVGAVAVEGGTLRWEGGTALVRYEVTALVQARPAAVAGAGRHRPG